MVEPDIREIGELQLMGGIACACSLELHVRLSRADPDLPDGDVVELEMVVAVDGEGERAGTVDRPEGYDPVASVAGHGRVGLAGEAHRHPLTGRRGAPHGDGLIPLDAHVVGE